MEPHTPDELRKVIPPTPENPQSPTLDIEPLSPENADQAFELFQKLFPDAAEDYPIEYIREIPTRQREGIRHAVLLFSDPEANQNPGPDGTPEKKYVGFRWLTYGDKGYAYTWYGGIHPDYQRKGYYTASAKASEEILRDKYNIQCLITECENPNHGDTPQELKDNKDRIRFFQDRLGYEFLDPEVQLFHRPEWRLDAEDDINQQRNQAVDITDYFFGFKAIGPKGPQIIEQNGKKYIKTEDLRDIYKGYIELEAMKDDPGIGEQYKSYHMFMDDLNKQPELISLFPHMSDQPPVEDIQHD